MAKATINDVARKARVSIKTVSRVLNGEPNVRDDTRSRVQSAIDALNYKPNQSARSLASSRSNIIGLVYDDPAAYAIPSAGYVINMQQGLLRTCGTMHFDLLLHPCNYREPDAGKKLAGMIEHANPDGLVLTAPLSNMQQIVRAIRDTGTPMVRVSPGSRVRNSSTVSTNDREGARDMTRYLASLGHERIAFITGHPQHAAVQDRLPGYAEGLQLSGLPKPGKLVVAGDNSIGSGERAAHQLLTRKRPPTAIFAANDDMAAGAMRAAYQLGMSIPDDVSIAGFDDIALARQIYPSLTTVRQPLVAMAEQAAVMLVHELQSGDKRPQHAVLPGEIIVRDSTGRIT